ncbi:MAG: FtsW/RodA/SpoVE family cell cycle protein, partial [Gallionella sp.]
MVSLVKTGARPPQTQFDELLLWVFVALLTIGLVMVYSASIATAEASKFTGYHASYYLIRHGIFIAVGVIAGIAAFQVPLQMWQNLAMPLFAIGTVLLVLVLIPHVGR